MAEGSIGHEPLLILCKELLEGLALHRLAALLGIKLTEILELGIVHALVVDLRQSVELFLQGIEVCLALGILQSRQLTEVGVLGMEGIDTDGVIGIAVLPGVGHVGIVDRQHLQHALLGLRTPVDHLLQVAEVAHAETALAAQGEDGNYGSCSLPGIDGEESLRQFVDNHLALLQLRQDDSTVLAILPKGCHVDFVVETYEFEL